MHYKVSFVGHCPQINDDRRISVELAEVTMIGTPSNQYKKMSFYCPDSDDCQHIDNSGYCPLAIAAPCHP